MSRIDFIKQLIGDLHAQMNIVLKDTTNQQFNWVPEGAVNPMSAIAIHILVAEDDFIHTVLQRKPSCWETGDWERATGVKIPPGPGRGWEDFKGAHIQVDPVMEYTAQVQAETKAYLEKVTEEDLEQMVNLFGNTIQAIDVLRLIITHGLCHIGEMDALKGQQGIRVLPV